MQYHSTDLKSCTKCGASFKRSPADRTVKCPDCRKQDRERRGLSSEIDFYTLKICEAKSRGYAARRAGDKAAEEAAISDLRHWQHARDSRSAA